MNVIFVNHSMSLLLKGLNDIVADLSNCAINRAINGKTSSFFEDIFKAYQYGLFRVVGKAIIQKEILLRIKLKNTLIKST